MADEESYENIHRIVHLDLKGAPPKLSYFEKLFPSLQLWGATGILVEYEDMFPYKDDLKDLASQDAYSPAAISHLQQIATDAGLIVIPLVQTFGHMEFVLKHEGFRYYRESRSYPNSICPSKEASLRLVCDMLSQVIELHPMIKWIHVGGDEVWQLGQCNDCLRKMADYGLTPEQLYLQHLKKVAEYVRETHPGIKVIAWDDMFRHTDEKILIGSHIHGLVEPMIWNYNPRDIDLHLPSDIWKLYANVFHHFWVASAFKGASGVNRQLPDIAHHIGNHESWSHTIRTAFGRSLLNMRGWALTGWQRYDHFAVLCELLPAAIPSLVICLQTIKHEKFDQKALEASSALLGSSKLLDMAQFTRPNVIADLPFPGSEIFVQIQNFANLETSYETTLKSDGFKGWFSEFHVKYRFGNPLHIQPMLASVSSLINSFRQLRNDMEISFGMIFNLKTIEEWLMENVDSKITHLTEVNGKLNDILKKN